MRQQHTGAGLAPPCQLGDRRRGGSQLLLVDRQNVVAGHELLPLGFAGEALDWSTGPHPARIHPDDVEPGPDGSGIPGSGTRPDVVDPGVAGAARVDEQ
jgi:hypothetical protein